MLLMDFPEVSETPGFLSLDFDVLAAVVSSDELNAAEECVFEACMNWIAAYTLTVLRVAFYRNPSWILPCIYYASLVSSNRISAKSQGRTALGYLS